jgi:hypothetical protein
LEKGKSWKEDQAHRMDPEKWVLINKSKHTRLCNQSREHAIWKSKLTDIAKHKQWNPTAETKVWIGALAAASPHISPINLETAFAVARYTFVVESGLDRLDDRLTPEAIRLSSPSSTSFDNCVKELAVVQCIIARDTIARATKLFVGYDQSPDGSMAKAIICHNEDDKTDHEDGTVCVFNLGNEKCGKTAPTVAAALRHSLRLVMPKDGMIHGTISDSGGATGYSVATEMQKPAADGQGPVIRLVENALIQLCAHHNDASIFREPAKKLLGENGLDNRNALQLLYNLYAFCKEVNVLGHTMFMKEFKTIWSDLHPGVPFPTDLHVHICKPVMTRWGTVTEAAKQHVYLDVFAGMAQAEVNRSKASESLNMIASDAVSLSREASIKCDLLLLAVLGEQLIDVQMAFNQKPDPHVGKSGHKSHHLMVRYFWLHLKLKELQDWRTLESGKDLRDSIEALPEQVSDNSKEVTREVEGKKVDAFFKMCYEFMAKHYSRQAKTNILFHGAFGEAETGRIIACWLLGGAHLDSGGGLLLNNDQQSFESVVHKREIDLHAFSAFLQEKSKNEITAIRHDPLAIECEAALLFIAKGGNIWDYDNPESEVHRKLALKLTAQPSTSQFVERLVKNSNQVRQTGKSDHMAMLYSIASNDFVSKEAKIDDSNPDKIKCTRINSKGKTRFDLLSNTIKKKRALLESLRGSPGFVDDEKEVKALLEKSSGHLEQRAETRFAEFVEQKDLFKENTKTKISGVDVPPLMQGMVHINNLKDKVRGKSTGDKEALREELKERNVEFRSTGTGTGMTRMKSLLRENLCEEWLASDPTRNLNFDAFKQTKAFKFFRPKVPTAFGL